MRWVGGTASPQRDEGLNPCESRAPQGREEMAVQAELRRDVWEGQDPARLFVVESGMARGVLRCFCGEQIAVSYAEVGEAECPRCGQLWRVRVVVEARSA